MASAGIMGIIVGLAARDTLANFFGSLSLYLDGTYAVGDFVVLESGERGRVEDISVRSTVIRTRDDILVTVPNSELNSAAIVNESTPRRSAGFGSRSASPTVPTSTRRGILPELAEAADLVQDRPNPRAGSESSATQR